MTVHKCPRCGYTTTNKTDIRRHYQRKVLCPPTEQDTNIDDEKNKYLKKKDTKFECTKCFKGFETKQGWQRHEQKCTVITPPLIPINTIPTYIDPIGPSTAISKEMVDFKDYIITEIKKELGEMIKNVPPPTIVNNVVEKVEKMEIQQNNIQQNNIIINDFGCEDIKHIYDDIAFMKSCFMNYEKGLTQFILKKWFDKEHPENHNIRMADIKNAAIEYYQMKRWNKAQLNNRVMDKILGYVGFEYQRFLELSPVFDKSFLDSFMDRIGYPLEWDLSHDDYDYDERPLNEYECNQIKDRLYEMVKKDVFIPE